MGVRRYLLRVLISVDQLANALAGGCPDETVSDSLYRHKTEGNLAACVACRALSWIFREDDHCRRAWLRGLQRMRDGLAASDHL